LRDGDTSSSVSLGKLIHVNSSYTLQTTIQPPINI